MTKVKVITEEGVELPKYETTGAAGLDVRAKLSENIQILPCHRALIPTGIKVEIPEGFEIQVRPRSGLAIKHGVTVVNSPGTIDSDYRGEVKVILINHGFEPFIVKNGDRIGQLILAKHDRIEWVETKTLESTDRGEGGFGSTSEHKPTAIFQQKAFTQIVLLLAKKLNKKIDFFTDFFDKENMIFGYGNMPTIAVDNSSFLCFVFKVSNNEEVSEEEMDIRKANITRKAIHLLISKVSGTNNQNDPLYQKSISDLSHYTDFRFQVATNYKKEKLVNAVHKSEKDRQFKIEDYSDHI